jgi:hypothetical protein
MFSKTLFRRLLLLTAAFVLAAALAIPMLAAPAPARAAASLPCDIYAAGGTPCEAAYSTTRALFASYNGPLYQIRRASDNSTLNIGLQAAGGIVNSSPQVSFCSGTTCTITELYDQTSNANNLPISPGSSCSGCGSSLNGPGPGGSDIGANAMALPVTIGGQPAYGVLVNNIGTGYRNNAATNVPTGAQPEGEYMMTSSNLTSSVCCFDFGSAETNDSDDGNATMNAIYYGSACWVGGCPGSGPWVGGDLENGMYFSANGQNPASITSETGSFLSAWEKNNGTTNFTLKYGNGNTGGLTTAYSGALPNGYNPMKVQPSIELGTGGDNSPMGKGEFFEGAVTAGFPSDATENAVQANLVAAGYGNNTTSFKTSQSVVSFRAHANGDYVDAANSTTSLIANATSIGAAETFDMVTNTDGTINLRAHSDNEWVTAESNGSAPLIANRGSAGPWETFYLIHNADGSVSLRAYNNQQIVTAGSSPLIANSTSIGTAQEFDLVTASTKEGPFGGTPAAIPGTVQAANYDTGGQGVAYNVTSVNGNGTAYRSDGVDLESCTDTGSPGCGDDLGWTGTGQWFKYTVNVATAGTYTLSLRLASPNGVTDGLHIANSSGTNLSGNINVPNTGGWQAYTTVTATVTLPAGQQTLTLDEDNGGFNIRYLTFASPSSSEGPYGGTPAPVPGTVQAANYDTGGQGVAYNVTSTNGTANSYRSDGIDLEACTDTGCGYDIGWTGTGQWFKYAVNVATARSYTVTLRLASPSGVTDGLHIASSSGANLSGNINVPATGGWQTWTTVTVTVTLPAGQQTLTLDEDNGGWNIHQLAFA